MSVKIVNHEFGRKTPTLDDETAEVQERAVEFVEELKRKQEQSEAVLIDRPRMLQDPSG